MTTIAELYGKPVTPGDLGIEIETEAEVAYALPTKSLRGAGWLHKGDGSLRGFGVEYVSNGPVAFANLRDHLAGWKNALGPSHGQLIPDSISTSVHVHVNVLGLTPLQALNFYILSVVFENVLSHYAGPDREGNLFALRTKDAETHYHALKNVVREARSENDLVRCFNPRGRDKIYTNIHTVPVQSFGTIEFRVMRGTTDIEEIGDWAEALFNIRQYSMKFANPCEILAAFKDVGPVEMMEAAFGEVAHKFQYDGFHNDICTNYYYLAELAMCRKTWKLEEAPKVVLKTRGTARGIADDGVVIRWNEEFVEEDF